jgi:hypothetical protein
VLLYLEQMAWGEYHEIKEYPTLNSLGYFYLELLKLYGIGLNFSWVDILSFQSINDIDLDKTEIELIKTGCIVYNNAIIRYSKDDELPPPYMSEEYKKQREQVLKYIRRSNFGDNK